MPHTPGMRHGTWCHLEIPTGSVESCKRFYGGLFDWTFTPSPTMPYTLYSAGEGDVGGGIYIPDPGTPKQIMAYVTVTDLEVAAKKVQELGGRVLTGPMDVQKFGRFRIVADPDGNTFGLWQSLHEPAPPAKRKPASRRPKAKARKKSR